MDASTAFLALERLFGEFINGLASDAERLEGIVDHGIKLVLGDSQLIGDNLFQDMLSSLQVHERIFKPFEIVLLGVAAPFEELSRVVGIS